MAQWRRNSIAGGPSPSSIRPSAAGVAFPCDGDGGATELEAAIGQTPRPTKAIADEAFSLAAADGDNRIAVAPPETLAPPLQPPPNFGLLHYIGLLGFLQPAGTAATGDGGHRRDGSRDTVSCPSPSSSQLPPLPELVSDSFYSNEAGDEEGGMSPGRSEEQEEEAVLYAQNGEIEEAGWSGRSEEGNEEMSPGRDDEDEDAMSSWSDEEEDGDEATSSWRPVEEEEDEEEEEEEDEEEEEEEEVPDECWYCGSMEALVMLLPCRHVCYCKPCFKKHAGLHCPDQDCGDRIDRAHDLCGGLGKRK